MAAAKHSTAAIMNASVSAVMKGPDMALGKKLWLVRVVNVFCGRLDVTVGPMLLSNVFIGLYPRKAAKRAPEAGTPWNALAI